MHTQCRDVLVRSAEEEHVHGNLRTRAFDGKSFIECRCGLQKARFLLMRGELLHYYYKILKEC